MELISKVKVEKLGSSLKPPSGSAVRWMGNGRKKVRNVGHSFYEKSKVNDKFV